MFLFIGIGHPESTELEFPVLDMWANGGLLSGRLFILGDTIPSLGGDISFPGLFSDPPGPGWDMRIGYRPAGSSRARPLGRSNPSRNFYGSIEATGNRANVGLLLSDFSTVGYTDRTSERTDLTGSGAAWLHTSWSHFPGVSIRAAAERSYDMMSRNDTNYKSHRVEGVENRDQLLKLDSVRISSAAWRISIRPETLPTAAVIGIEVEQTRRCRVDTDSTYYRYMSRFTETDTAYDTTTSYRFNLEEEDSRSNALSGDFLLFPGAPPSSMISLRAEHSSFSTNSVEKKRETSFSALSNRMFARDTTYLEQESADWEKGILGCDLFVGFRHPFSPVTAFAALTAGASFTFVSYLSSDPPLLDQVKRFLDEYDESHRYIGIPLALKWSHRGFFAMGEWTPSYESKHIRFRSFHSPDMKERTLDETRLHRNLILRKYAFTLGYQTGMGISVWLKPEFSYSLSAISGEVVLQW